MTYRIGSLFAGIGGLERGLEAAGLGPTLWQVEQSPYCREILAQHWPHAERYDDVRTVDAASLAPVDVLCGGFPCQDVSGAGKGAGLAGARSGLWREFARLAGELGPRWVCVENVASGAGRWVDAVVRELEQLGYAPLPLPVSASDLGAPHRRARIFVVARRVPDAIRDALWVGPERRSEGRPGPLPDARQPLPRDRGGQLADAHGEHAQGAAAPRATARRRLSADARGAGAVADTDGHRLEGGRLGEHAQLARAPRPEPHRRGRDRPLGWPPGPLDERGWHHWLRRGGPSFRAGRPVRRDADGVSYRMDRRFRREALRALGNAVVPACAEVAGWVMRELDDDGGERP